MASVKSKKVFKYVLIVFLAILLVVMSYATYFVLGFKRVGNIALVAEAGTNKNTANVSKEYSLLSWNIGFGAYSSDYTFFMDGGKSGRAKSEQAVKDNLNGMMDEVDKYKASANGDKFDFICFQEVDVFGTRSYGVNQKQILRERYSSYFATFAQNYDSPYIAIPLTDAHGKNQAGLLTLSDFSIKSAQRIELPIEKGLMKFFDLDRCFAVNRIDLSNGKQLVLINLHLSAYTSDGTIADDQIKIITALCKQEYEAGNYVICAGDFNKDLLGNSAEVFGVSDENYSWSRSFNQELLAGSGMKVVAPTGAEGSAVPSCRCADIPYEKGKSFVITLDGFMVSENVEVKSALVFDAEFKYSDHNPVMLKFTLKKQ